MAGSGRRACPTCGVPTPWGTSTGGRRSVVRWCGSCGAALDAVGTAGGTTSGTAGGTTSGTTGRRLRGSSPAIVAVAAMVALVTVAGLGIHTAGGRLVGSSSASLDVELGPEEVAATLRDPVSEDGPVCLVSPGCVAWVQPASVAGRTPATTVVDDVTLVRVHDGLDARHTDDGVLRWHAPLAEAPNPSSYLPVLAAGDLALVTETTPEHSTLRALELRTGEPRWSVPHVDEVADVRPYGDVLLAHVTRPVDALGASVRSLGSTVEQVLAIDPGTGDLRWSVEGDLLHLVDDGAVVMGDGEVSVVDPEGAAVWRRPLEADHAPAWLDVTGRFLRLYDGQGRGGPVWSLTDGEAFEVDGELVPVADPEGEPRDPFRSSLAAILTRRADGATGLALVDGDQVTWRVTFDQLGCCAPLQLDGDRISVPAADGGRWLLSRDDGAVVDRTPPPETRPGASAFLPSYGGFSVEELDVASVATSDLALVEDGQRTARLPAGTWPVGATDQVVVVRSHAWVAAIRRDAGPSENSTTNER